MKPRLLVIALSLVAEATAASYLVEAYDVDTHTAIGARALEISAIDPILKTELNLEKGVETQLREPSSNQLVTVTELISRGAGSEDEPFMRVLNHFHNPLAPRWEEAGLRALGGSVRGHSATLWQQNTAQDAVSGGGNWSWQETRQRYLAALTGETRAQRERAFAETFRGLGQLMHLVQDASVPAHVRNDPHLLFVNPDWYEDWVEETRVGNPALFASLLAETAPRPPTALFTATGHDEAPVPVARLIDSDTVHAGGDAGILRNLGIGLAEYTNGTFLSRDTLFKGFALPRPPRPETGFLEADGAKFRRYFPNVDAGGQVEIRRFVTEGVLYDSLSAEVGIPPAGGWMLTPRVHEDYATKLLPRAVGYSAALLDYFFRGRLDVELIEADPRDPSVIRLSGVNASPEPLDGGTLGIYADDATGTRRAATALETVRTVSAASGAALASARFRAPADAERFVAVYQGTLGNERAVPNADPARAFPGAVIGKVLGSVRVEEVFAAGGRWKVRTPRGVFVLPLTSAEFPQVKWGDADSVLVARTRFGAGQPNRVVAYEVERQKDSVELVATSTPDGPALRLRQIGEAVFPFGTPLGTRVNFAQTIAHRQELIRIERTVTSVYDDAAGIYRVVQADFSTPTVETAIDTEVPFSRTFPIVLDLEHLFTVDPVPYGWELIDVATDRTGRLLGLVAIYLTDTGLEPAAFPLYFVNREGELFPVGQTSVVPRYPTGISQIWALVDLSGGRILASTADPVITISWRERAVLGPVSRPVVGLAVAMRSVEVRHGGPDPGVFDLGWRAQSFLGPNYPRDAISATFAATAGIQALTVAGELRAELRAAAAGAGFADFTLTRTHVVSEHVYGCQAEAPQPSGCLALRVSGDGSDISRAPAQLESALRSRPAPAGERLVFLTTDYTAGAVALAALIVWDPATSRAQVRHRLPGLSNADAHALVAATGTAVLVVSEMLDVLATDPFVTTSAVVALEGTAPPAIFTGQDLGGAFTLLDPGYLYNVRDLKFYRARPPLQRTALPASLATVPAKPVGDHHVIRLP